MHKEVKKWLKEIANTVLFSMVICIVGLLLLLQIRLAFLFEKLEDAKSVTVTNEVVEHKVVYVQKEVFHTNEILGYSVHIINATNYATEHN